MSQFPGVPVHHRYQLANLSAVTSCVRSRRMITLQQLMESQTQLTNRNEIGKISQVVQNEAEQ